MVDILKIFEETGGILKGHFQLASGRHADTYMQCAKLFMHADKSKLLCSLLKDKMANEKFDYVISPAVGGLLMGYEMSYQLEVPNIFAERVDGTMTLKRGFSIEKGKKYLVVEDVVTTGGSVKEVIDLVESLGGFVEAVASIVDRSNGTVNFNKKFYSLLCMEILSFENNNCPLCAKGIPVEKPGTKASQKK